MKKYKLTVLLCLVIVIEIVFYFLMNKITSLNPEIIIFDIKLFYTPELFYENILLYTKEIEMYLMIFRAIDMIFPIAFALLLIQLFKKLKSKHILFPLMAMFCDLFENFLLAFKMFHNSSSNEFVVYVINAFTITKFLSIIISITLIIILFVKKKTTKDEF